MAKEVKDIILDANNDLLIEDGDFVMAPSDDQHIKLILLNAPGQLRHAPLIGVAIQRYEKSRFNLMTTTRLKQDIRLHLQLDGFNEATIETIIGDSITVNAER